MRLPDYLDFDLELTTETDGSYTARVLNSPKGEASVPVTIPVTGTELENVILKLGRTRSGVRSLDSPQAQLARSFGTRLFDSVFAGEVGTTLRRSLDEAEDAGKGLRIRLHLSDVPTLADVPWEYLYSTGLGRFLVLSGDTPLVRYLDLPREVPPLTVTPPLRILLVVSGPSDLAALDYEQEVARMTSALAELIEGGFIIVDPLAKPTLAELRRALRRREYHVLHFIGHGGFDTAAGDGVLAFEDDAGRAHLVRGADLGTLLHDHRTLRLAVLNACEGARQSPADPFSGVAQSLVRQGLPAVVAMQFEITDNAALIFGEEFYACVADGYPIDAALTQARMAIFASDNDVEWGTPVLYLRARDGRIFAIPPGAPPAPRASTTVPHQVAGMSVTPPPTNTPTRPASQTGTPPMVEAVGRSDGVTGTGRGDATGGEEPGGPPTPGNGARKGRYAAGAVALVVLVVLVVLGIRMLSGGATPGAGPTRSEPASDVAASGQLELGIDDWADLYGGKVSNARAMGQEVGLYHPVDDYWLHAAIAQTFALSSGADRASCVAALGKRADSYVVLSTVKTGQIVCVRMSDEHVAALILTELPATGSPKLGFTYTVFR